MKDLNLFRKLEHAAIGCTIAALVARCESTQTMARALGGLTACYAVAEVLRFNWPTFNRAFMKVFAPFIREKELKTIHSGVPYAASCAVVVAMFPRPIAILSILYLAIGDPIAACAGTFWGHYGPKLARGRTLIGSLAAVIACSLVTGAYLPSPLLIGVGAIAGGLAELIWLPLPVVGDDNFLIPIVSALALSAASFAAAAG